MRSNLINAIDNTLASAVAAPDPTINVTSSTDLPAVPFYLVIDPFGIDLGREYMLCTNVAGTTLTVTRNLEGTVSQAHSIGAIVRFAYSKQHLDDLWDSIETSLARQHDDLTDVTASQHHTRYSDAEAISATAASYLPLIGGTLSGPLVLDAAPIVGLEATTKQYVDDRDGLYLPLSGGVLTGFLTLDDDPTALLHAATKQYVDAGDAAGYQSPLTTLGDVLRYGTVDERLSVGTAGQVLTVTAGEPTWEDPVTGVTDHALLTNVTASQHHTKYSDSEAISANTGLWLSVSGGTLTGFLTLNDDPTDLLHAATKQYVDANAGGGGTEHTVSATPPGSPALGDVWVDPTAAPAPGDFLPISGGTLISTQLLASKLVRNMTASVSAPGSPVTGDLWLNIS